MSETAIFSYKQSEYYSGAENQFTIRWNDPSLNITWPINNPILSSRDLQAQDIKL
jgi:dTDP-4-dehydrorhamnose 3,5-epimerase